MTRPQPEERKSLRHNRRAPLTPRQIASLLSDAADGVPLEYLARRFGLDSRAVAEIVRSGMGDGR